MVEQGGLIITTKNTHGLNAPEIKLEYWPLKTSKKNTFVYLLAQLEPLLPKKEVKGLFHTHRLMPLPGFRDRQTMKQLVNKFDRPLWLGIIVRERLFIWQFTKNWLSLLFPSFIGFIKITDCTFCRQQTVNTSQFI